MVDLYGEFGYGIRNLFEEDRVEIGVEGSGIFFF